MEDLEARKVYQILPDREAAREGYIRVVAIRSERARLRERARVEESEGQSPSDKSGCGGAQPSVLAAVVGRGVVSRWNLPY